MRLYVVKVLYFVTILLIMVRLGYWQLIRSDDLAAKAESQRIDTREVVAARGPIFFADRSILASTEPNFLVFGSPQVIKNEVQGKGLEAYKKDFSQKLAEIFWEDDRIKHLPIEQLNKDASSAAEEKKNEPPPEEIKKRQIEDLAKDIYGKISKELYWVSLGRKVNIETKQKIEKLALLGVGFNKSTTRFYPEGSSSAHLLGFVGSDIYGNQTGYFGLEGFYNGELRGQKGFFVQEKDALGLPILIGRFRDREPKEGKTLILNIDRTIQHLVEQKLKKGMLEYQAKSGSVVIMEPSTGNILAMASLPGYDPAQVADYPKENFKNPVVADGYEPGSTFKILVMAGALNEGVVRPDTVCDICSGPIDLGGFTIRTWNNQYRPNSTMTDVIIHSDNIGMVFVSKKLGIDKLYSYISKFGIGSPTGIDLQDEQSPDLRSKDTWREIDQATASFGQGISVTAIQVLRAVAAIANGGKLMEPHLVAEIRDGQGSFKINPKVVDQPVSKETAQVVKEMMVKAVNEGEAQYYKKAAGLGGFKIAGKTGTAQIPVQGHYDPNKTIASFVGFAPADDPKFVILVRYQEPQASIFGAETAAPTFFDIAKDLFIYYGIAPEKQ